ncbi:MAG: phenyllactate dehydratase [Bacillota bacterium]|jgi:benzoyl-CoA reductase/2-hydroxyglutaryl-CoA dehydratase subunit BcrC/BadD/HgdB|nr:phenyllactate dehydratase [Bacillota bacterium]
MSKAMSLISELAYAGQRPKDSILKAMNETGKKSVGCFPIYTPEELIYAAEMLPVGMWGGQTVGTLADRYLQGFCCSIMKANTEQALLGQYDFLSAVIVTAYCDTLKCMIENWKIASPQLNLIPMVYPQNRKIPAGKEYLRDEFLRVKKELERISGKKITDQEIQKSVDLYDEYRRTMQEFSDLVKDYPDMLKAKTRHLILKASYFMDKRIYTEKVRELILELSKLPRENAFGRKKIILSGLIAEPDGILDIMTENGMVVVADDLAHGARQFRTIAPDTGDGLNRMVERVAMQDGCAFLYDEKKTRAAMLIQMKEKYQADAVIVCQMKFCDPEEFDYPIIKKELEGAGIPSLYIEIEQQMDSLEQLRTRIQSFSEMLA